MSTPQKFRVEIKFLHIQILVILENISKFINFSVIIFSVIGIVFCEPLNVQNQMC